MHYFFVFLCCQFAPFFFFLLLLFLLPPISISHPGGGVPFFGGYLLIVFTQLNKYQILPLARYCRHLEWTFWLSRWLKRKQYRQQLTLTMILTVHITGEMRLWNETFYKRLCYNLLSFNLPDSFCSSTLMPFLHQGSNSIWLMKQQNLTPQRAQELWYEGWE